MPEEQEYVERYCELCKKDRIFVTSLSPKKHLICCVCGYRESTNSTEMIQDQFGCKFVEKRSKSKIHKLVGKETIVKDGKIVTEKDIYERGDDLRK